MLALLDQKCDHVLVFIKTMLLLCILKPRLRTPPTPPTLYQAIARAVTSRTIPSSSTPLPPLLIQQRSKTLSAVLLVAVHLLTPQPIAPTHLPSLANHQCQPSLALLLLTPGLLSLEALDIQGLLCQASH